MSEILNEISAEVKQFLDTERYYVHREMSRRAIITTDGVDIEIVQSKRISAEEMEVIRADGPAALATTEWFNDVEWMQQLPDNPPPRQRLILDALYPVEFFDEKPTSGLFSGNRWLDQYRSYSGSGDSESSINNWVLEFVDTTDHTVRYLRYRDEPAALDIYNARYRQYLDQLDSADPTVSYNRGWERFSSRDRNKTPLILGQLSLGGFGAYDIVHLGESATEDEVNNTHIRLNHEDELDKYVGSSIDIAKGKAMVEPYWDGEDDIKPASEELLATTLKLVQDTTRGNKS